jgi:hypothetical protein
MEHDVVYLEQIYRFARAHFREANTSGKEENPICIDKSSHFGNEYSAICRQMLSGVSEQAGLYLWGFYNPHNFWVNIYIGKTKRGKTARLQKRLFEELTKERASIWREVFPYDKLFEVAERVHPARTWPKIKVKWERALRKAGSTHIFWVATPHLADEHLKAVEEDLIEAMNPTGNKDRRMPPRGFDRESEKVLSIFRQMIHNDTNRRSQFHLKYHNEFWRWVGESGAVP